MNNPTHNKGLTLIEVMIVVAIIGLLLAIAVPMLSKEAHSREGLPRLQVQSDWIRVDQRSEAAVIHDNLKGNNYCVLRSIKNTTNTPPQLEK